MNSKARMIFMGTPDFAVPVLKACLEKYDVKLVVTQPDKLVGKKQELVFSPIKKVALEHNISVFQPEKIRNDYEIISEINPDIIVTCAYGQIIPEDILNIPKYGCINVHASLLPKYRGASPMQAAILNGDTTTGVTIMYMDKNMDTGDIIAKEEIPINIDDDIGTIHDKLSLLGRDLLVKTMDKILDGSAERQKQDEASATYTKLIKREDEKLSFDDKAINIYNKIRAFSPLPLCFISLNIGDIKIIKASYINEKVNSVGQVIVNKNNIAITCQDGLIILEKIKPIGKKEMAIKAFINGLKGKNLFLIK